MKGEKEYAEKLFSHIPELDPGIEVVKFDVQVDHVYMVVVFAPKYAVARVVRYIKSRSENELIGGNSFSEKCLFIQRRHLGSRLLCIVHRLGRKGIPRLCGAPRERG